MHPPVTTRQATPDATARAGRTSRSAPPLTPSTADGSADDPDRRPPGGDGANRRRLLTAIAGGDTVVNVTGPLGVGKTTVVEHLRETRSDLLILDDVDDDAAVAHASTTAARFRAAAARAGAGDARAGTENARTTVDARSDNTASPHPAGHPRPTTLVLVSRRPVAASPHWSGGEPTVVRLRPWRPSDLTELTGPGDLGTRLAGGLPLFAAVIGRLRLGDVREAPAVAAALAAEILDRLRREAAGTDLGELVGALAAAGAADEEMLGHLVDVPDGGFAALGALSIVDRDGLGLTMREPYRTILDLGLGWSRPLHRRTLLTKGLAHRGRQIAAAPPRHRDLGRLLDRTLMLIDEPAVRQALFPATVPDVAVRRAGAEDYDDVVRLTRAWSARSGMHPGFSARAVDAWWDHDPAAFRIAVDPSGATRGVCHLLPVAADAADAVEPLLQQHLPDALTAGEGLVLGLAFGEAGVPGVLSAVLRHALIAGAASGRLLVSTQWPPYQRLSLGIGLTRLGHTRHDLYRCGRPNDVFDWTLSASGGRDWLRTLGTAASGGTPVPDRWDAAVRQGLAHLGEPARLAVNPLITLPPIGSPQRLSAALRQAVELLAAADDARDAEAGRLLHRRYVDRSGHDAALREARMSRATYFRRINHGIGRVGEILQAVRAAAR